MTKALQCALFSVGFVRLLAAWEQNQRFHAEMSPAGINLRWYWNCVEGLRVDLTGNEKLKATHSALSVSWGIGALGCVVAEPKFPS